MIKKENRVEVAHLLNVKAENNLEKTEDNISAALTGGDDGNTEWLIIEFYKLPTIIKIEVNSILI